jgi:hypothetical protein
MESRIVRICRAGDQLSGSRSVNGQVGLGKISQYLSLTLQDIEADAAETIDVGVVDLGKEADLGRGHGVVIGKEELKTEDSTCSSSF